MQKTKITLGARWGGIPLPDGDFTSVPNKFIGNIGRLGLKPEDVAVILVLMSYKYGTSHPSPSVESVANALGYRPSKDGVYRGLQKSFKRMEKAGLLKRHLRPVAPRRNATNEYDLTGLFERMRSLLAEEKVPAHAEPPPPIEPGPPVNPVSPAVPAQHVSDAYSIVERSSVGDLLDREAVHAIWEAHGLTFEQIDQCPDPESRDVLLCPGRPGETVPRTRAAVDAALKIAKEPRELVAARLERERRSAAEKTAAEHRRQLRERIAKLTKDYERDAPAVMPGDDQQLNYILYRVASDRRREPHERGLHDGDIQLIADWYVLGSPHLNQRLEEQQTPVAAA